MGTNPGSEGLHLYNALPFNGAAGGLQTPFATILAPAVRTVFVRSTGPQDGDNSSIVDKLVPTLAAALLQCRAGLGDIIYVLPGHTENVTDATMLDNLRAGTRIVGVGAGSNRPTFTWTATGSQWTLDQNDVRISGLKLVMAGIAVVDGIEVTGADCAIIGCELEVADAVAAAVIVCSVAAAGDRFEFSGNHVRGTAGDQVTDTVLIDGAADGVRISHNLIQAAATAATGHIRIAAVATNLYIGHNTIDNTEAASVGCIAFGAQASTGVVEHNNMSTLNDGVATAQGIIAGATTLARFFENYSSDEPRLSGILTPVAAT